MTCTGLSYGTEFVDTVCFAYLMCGSTMCVRLLDVLLLSWLDLLLLCTSHNHIHCDYWHKGESLERGCRCTAAAVLLLYCSILLLWLLGWASVSAKTNPPLFLIVLCGYASTQPTHTYMKAHAHKEAPSVAVTMECRCCCCAIGDSKEGNTTGLVMLYGGWESGANTKMREGSGLFKNMWGFLCTYSA